MQEGSRKKQRSNVGTQPQNEEIMMDTDLQPPLNLQHQQLMTSRGGPAGPSWSCKGCGRCNIHHTLSVSGCWACMQMKLNGPVFDADKWGDFTICQQMKADRLSSQK